ncbi:hypothetical protein [Yersinia aleksiciae]|nr:hypothetical protein [Yersinia aleksiciae]
MRPKGDGIFTGEVAVELTHTERRLTRYFSRILIVLLPALFAGGISLDPDY